LQIASFKNGSAKVCLTEIQFMQRTVGPFHFFQAHFSERGKLDEAMLNLHAQQERVAVFKMQPKDFAISENDIPEAGIAQFGHAELAAIENTV
jgi:hypothetical protein